MKIPTVGIWGMIREKGGKTLKIITLANQKGGIGKTTTATCLAAILNEWGHKTLLVDTDVQCNSTDTFRAATEDVATLYDLILDDDPCTLEEAIQHTEAGDIIASDPGLEEADVKLRDTDAFFKLKDALEGLEGYEYVVIDTNPAVNVMLHNALVAADEVIIPVTADRYTVKGLSQLVQKRLNPKLRIRGLLLVRYDERTNLNKSIGKSLLDIADQIGTKVFDTYIRDSVKCRESQTERMTLIKYAPKCTTEQDYEAFVKELLEEG